MNRPPSIVSFERLYLGSLGLWLLNAVIFWSRNQATMATMPQMQTAPQLMSVLLPIMVGSLVVTAAVTLLFWYLVARQASVVGKWLVVVSEALGALAAIVALVGLVNGTAANPTGVVLGLVATALAVAAAVMLFRADTRVWFGEGAAPMGGGPVEPLA